MTNEAGRQVYEALGVKPMINATGNQTLIGGSRVAPRIQEAMEAANRYFVDMDELIQKTGVLVAEMVGAEAAMVTPGCAAALALSSAACMSGSDGEKVEQLPDTTGIPNRFLIQKRQRYHYDRCLTIFGGKLVEVGDEGGTTGAQLEAAISEQTAAIHYYAPGGNEGVLPAEEVIRIAHANGVPVIVDAASQVYPLDRLRVYPEMGADLVGYGAKYFGACNSTGVLCGRKELLDAAYLHSFIGYETCPYDTIGRPLKLDRQEVVAVVVALQEWLNMDHEARLAGHEQKARAMLKALQGIPNITVELALERRGLSSGVQVRVDEGGLGKSGAEVIQELKEGDPGVWVRGSGNTFRVAVTNLIDGDEEEVVGRLKAVLSK